MAHLNGLYFSIVLAISKLLSLDGETASKMLCSIAIGNTG